MDKLEIASYLLTAALCGLSFGLSGRFLIEYFWFGNDKYIITSFDIWFDWFGLFILAWSVIIVNNMRLYRSEKSSRNLTTASLPASVSE